MLRRAQTTSVHQSAFQGKISNIKLTEHLMKSDVKPKFRSSQKAQFLYGMDDIDISKMLEVEISKMDIEILNNSHKRYILQTNLTKQINESQILLQKVQNIESEYIINAKKMRQIRITNKQMIRSSKM